MYGVNYNIYCVSDYFHYAMSVELNSSESDFSDSDTDDITDFTNMAYKYDHLFPSGLKYSGQVTDDVDQFFSRFNDYAVLKKLYR